MKSDGLIKNISAVFTANLGAQAITLITIPLIARIFPPLEYGKLTTIWALAVLFGAVSCLKYEETIILEKDDETANILASNCVLISVIVALCTWLLITGFETFINDSYFKTNSAPLMISIGVLFFGLTKTYNSLAVKGGMFKLFSASLLLGASFSAIWKILIGHLVSADADILLIGNILGLLVPVALLKFNFDKKKKLSNRSISLKDRLNTLNHYLDFPTMQAPNAIMNAVQQQAPIIILASYYDSNLIGFYGLAIAVIMRPLNALTSAISKVYLKRVVDRNADSHYRDLIKITSLLAALSILPFGILGAYGSDIFIFLLGDPWRNSGYIASLLAPWFFIITLKSPITQVLIARRELRFILSFNVTYMLVRIIGIFGAIAIFKDFYFVLITFSMIGLIGNTYYIYKGIDMSLNV